MSLLNRKLRRDLIALKSQAAAVALVTACGLQKGDSVIVYPGDKVREGSRVVARAVNGQD
jgi:hypothetical protein